MSTGNANQKSARDVAVDRSVAMLKASGAVFAIITQSGETIIHGDIAISEAPKRRPRPDRPIGALVNHYRPFIEPMTPGDCVTVPFGSFSPRELRSAMSAWMTTHWGHKSYICVQKETEFEVLRVV